MDEIHRFPALAGNHCFQEGCMQGREIIIRYGDGTEQTLPSMTAAVMHLNISASTIRKYGKSGKAVDTKYGEVTIKIVDKE